MFRYASVIILFFALAAQSFQGTFLIVGYYTNRSEFLKNCENKLRPALHCNGQCVLMKKLRAQEKQEQHDAVQKNNAKAEWIAGQTPIAAPSSSFTYIPAQPLTGLQHFLLAGHLRS